MDDGCDDKARARKTSRLSVSLHLQKKSTARGRGAEPGVPVCCCLPADPPPECGVPRCLLLPALKPLPRAAAAAVAAIRALSGVLRRREGLGADAQRSACFPAAVCGAPVGVKSSMLLNAQRTLQESPPVSPLGANYSNKHTHRLAPPGVGRGVVAAAFTTLPPAPCKGGVGVGLLAAAPYGVNADAGVAY